MGSISEWHIRDVEDVTKPSHPRVGLLKKVWKLNIPPKVKNFVWLLIRKRLQVRARLHRFMQHISPIYPFCQSLPETIQHMFMDCQYAKDVWALSPDLMPLPSQAGDLYIWLLSLSPTSTKSELDPLSKALLICWQIWEARNNVVFHDSKATLASCFHAAACVGLDFWRLNSKARLDSADSMMIK
ncbi:hypothetical protein PRUPE_6G308200 [Prunus persica]|uniref:Reverse transcriptase zinc-binding domain-containing protein n=1 Tax=Prunus persica TaxID=3760 RepID=M5W3V2_PRUPE|nr:hypothetical protein PRUPE_6G308200 [Prunus persica]